MKVFKLNSRLSPVILVLFLIATVILGGCRSVSAPSTSGASWNVPEWEKRKMAKDPVWDSIREKKIGIDRPLDIVDLLGIALKNSPKTKEAWEQARAQEAQLVQTQGALFPEVSGGMDIEYQKTKVNKRTETVNQWQYTPSANLSMLLFDFGGRSASIQKAYQELLAANYEFNQTIQDLFLDTATSYFKLYASQSALEAAEADVADAKTALDSAKIRFNAGLVSKLDVLQAQSTYDNSLYRREDAKGQIQVNKASLAEVIGFPADTPFEITEPSGDMLNGITEENVTILIEQALKDRPDIAAAKASLRAKEEAVKEATSDLLPNVNAEASTDHNNYYYFGKMRGVNTNIKEDFSYGGLLSVKWNIFDGLSNYFKRIEAQREAAAEKQKLTQEELSASADVWSKFYAFKTAQQKEVFSEAFLESAKSSHDLAQAGYKAGLKDILDLLSAQSQLSEARSQYIQSKEDVFTAFSELAHATGALATPGGLLEEVFEKEE